MEATEMIELEKAINKAKFKLTQKAGELHDLIEDRLLDEFEDIPSVAEATYRAAKEWEALTLQLKAAKA